MIYSSRYQDMSIDRTPFSQAFSLLKRRLTMSRLLGVVCRTVCLITHISEQNTCRSLFYSRPQTQRRIEARTQITYVFEST